MKVLIVVACLVAVTLAQSQNSAQFEDDKKIRTSTYIPIISQSKDQGQDGSYSQAYETGNNIQAEESGFLKDITADHPGGTLVQHGQYSYEAPDGTLVSVQYTADETGFHATGDHIPTPPPVSAEIQKGLDLIYAGIKANQEKAASDPEYAKKQADRKTLDYTGQYYPQ